MAVSLYRLAIAMKSIVAALVVIACHAAGDASIRYGLFVAAHVLNVSGFLLSAIADRLLRRKISSVALVFTLAIEFLLGVLGPISMSAAAAADFRT